MPLPSLIRSPRIGRHSQWRAVTISVAATILAVALLWPVLTTITESSNINWHALSEVGQAYGAVSAVLSGLALGGVVVSLLIQQRQARTSTQYAIRERHFDLLKLMLDQPDLMYGFAMDPRDPAHVYDVDAARSRGSRHQERTWGDVSRFRRKGLVEWWRLGMDGRSTSTLTTVPFSRSGGVRKSRIGGSSPRPT